MVDMKPYREPIQLVGGALELELLMLLVLLLGFESGPLACRSRL